MVKFNKHLQSRKVSKWAKDYIDYKSLKQIINEIYIKLRISDSQPQKKNEDKDLFEPKPMFSIENPQFSVTPDKPKEEKTKDALVQKFITELENDSDLQFTIDNFTMKSKSATFVVKNIRVLKENTTAKTTRTNTTSENDASNKTTDTESEKTEKMTNAVANTFAPRYSENQTY